MRIFKGCGFHCGLDFGMEIDGCVDNFSYVVSGCALEETLDNFIVSLLFVYRVVGRRGVAK